MKKFVILFFSVLLFIGILACGWQFHGEKENVSKITVACVGDSITFRHGFEKDLENNYPYVLAKLLGEEYKVRNFGESGTCVQADGDCVYMDQRVYKEGIKYQADILIFMLGTNDSKEWNWTDNETFRNAYEELLDSYVNANDSAKIYIGISPKAFSRAFGIEPDVVEQIVNIQMEVAKERGYSVINIYELSALHPEWFEEDGIHPTKEGANGIARAVADTILNDN